MEITNQLTFSRIERIKDNIYRNKYICIEMSKEIFTKILTVVIFWPADSGEFSLCLSEFSNFHTVNNYCINDACNKSLGTVLAHTLAQKMVGIIVNIKQ